MEDSIRTYGVRVHAYTIMPNHFHLLVQTPKANLSEFMRHFNICYTGWFNFRHDRCGHLFQGRYKAFLVDADNYLLEVSRYIHLNHARSLQKDPTNQDLWSKTMSYKWSSLPGYINDRSTLRFITYDLVLEMIGGRRSYRDFVKDGIEHEDQNPFEKVKEGAILGDADFIATVKSKFLSDGSLSEQPAYKNLVVPRIDPHLIIQTICESLGLDAATATKKMADGVTKGILCELLYRYSGLKETEIGELLGGIGYAAVSQSRRRLKQKTLENKNIGERLKSVEQRLAGLLSSVKI